MRASPARNWAAVTADAACRPPYPMSDTYSGCSTRSENAVAAAGTFASAHRPSAPATAADDLWLATGGEAGELVQWDAATGKEVRRLAGHAEAVRARSYSGRRR